MEWFKRLFDPEYCRVEHFIASASMKKELLVLVWDTYSGSTIPYTTKTSAHWFSLYDHFTQGKSQYIYEIHDFREKEEE